MLQGVLCGALLNALCINPQLIRYCVQHSVFNIYSKHTFLQIVICHAQVSASSPRICRPRLGSTIHFCVLLFAELLVLDFTLCEARNAVLGSPHACASMKLAAP